MTKHTPEIYAKPRKGKRAVNSALAELRRNAGLRQSDVAQNLGVSLVCVQLWEKADTVPSLKNAYNMSKLYGCTMDEVADAFFSDQLNKALSDTDTADPE